MIPFVLLGGVLQSAGAAFPPLLRDEPLNPLPSLVPDLSHELDGLPLRILWALAPAPGIHVVLDESGSLPGSVARGWDRTTGFMVNVHDGGKLEYLEIGRAVALGYREPVDYHAVVDLPQGPRWTYPPGAPIGADEWRSILQRLARCSASDMWVGSSKPWRVAIPGAGA
jgi:hypothetical protein